MMLIFLIIIAVAAYFIYKSIGKNEAPDFKDHEALLNERFARGEIDLDTFKQMKSELNK